MNVELYLSINIAHTNTCIHTYLQTYCMYIIDAGMHGLCYYFTHRVAQAIDVSLQYSGGYGFESHPRQVTGRNRFLLSICMVECSV